MRNFTLAFLSIILCAFYSCSNPSLEESNTEDVLQHISLLQDYFVPDSRVARFDVTVKQQDGIYVLDGGTNLPLAVDSLLFLLEKNNITVENQISVWPEADLQDKVYALTRHSVANLRSERGHSQELATQQTLGTPLMVLKKEKEWYFVQCPDGYLAWIHGGEIALKTSEEITAWKKADRVIVTLDYGNSFESKEMTTTMGDLVHGSILVRLEEGKLTTKVAYPDGREAYVLSKYLQGFEEYLTSHPLAYPRTLSIAKAQIGKPYLWGGTSPKGMDCSGFTKMLYQQQGLIIPRDASQQIKAGIPIEYNEALEGLHAGDFLFFGRFRDDGTEKITHVGLYVGDGRFIHSGSDNGASKEQSLIPNTADFVPHRRESLLRARRLTPGTPNVIAVRNHMWYW